MLCLPSFLLLTFLLSDLAPMRAGSVSTSSDATSLAPTIPTSIQSDYPSLMPSDKPSLVPSENPSLAPSTFEMLPEVPSSIPSDTPSLEPSSVPSDKPSRIPSDTPSRVPSNMPSRKPSDVLSRIPSDLPSRVPSDMPSRVPSDAPSRLPSDMPSQVPSEMPSDLPSDMPSSIPSQHPSLSPTLALFLKRAESFALECYSDLTDIAKLEIQLLDDSVLRTYILCPNTTFQVGAFNGAGQLIGQAPIMARSNVVYKCGAEGLSTNNCILQGGSVQLTTIGFSISNVLIQGLTFEGAAERGITLGESGDITFLDCIIQVSETVHGHNESRSMSDTFQFFSFCSGNIFRVPFTSTLVLLIVR